MSTYESELDAILDPLARWTLHSWDGNVRSCVSSTLNPAASQSREILDRGSNTMISVFTCANLAF